MDSDATRARRILIVEDDYFIARDLSNEFRDAGIEIVGPIGSLARALSVIEVAGIDGAVLEVNLDGEKVYEVADALIGRAVPVVFVTGYERHSLPARYGDVPVCVKPVGGERIIEALRRAGSL